MTSAATKTKKRVYLCGVCGRKLRNRYVYSRHTGNRYCHPGDGCAK